MRWVGFLVIKHFVHKNMLTYPWTHTWTLTISTVNNTMKVLIVQMSLYYKCMLVLIKCCTHLSYRSELMIAYKAYLASTLLAFGTPSYYRWTQKNTTLLCHLILAVAVSVVRPWFPQNCMSEVYHFLRLLQLRGAKTVNPGMALINAELQVEG